MANEANQRPRKRRLEIYPAEGVQEFHRPAGETNQLTVRQAIVVRGRSFVANRDISVWWDGQNYPPVVGHTNTAGTFYVSMVAPEEIGASILMAVPTEWIEELEVDVHAEYQEIWKNGQLIQVPIQNDPTELPAWAMRPLT